MPYHTEIFILNNMDLKKQLAGGVRTYKKIDNLRIFDNHRYKLLFHDSAAN